MCCTPLYEVFCSFFHQHTHMCAYTHSQRCFAQMFTAREAEIQKLYIIMGGCTPRGVLGGIFTLFSGGVFGPP